MNEEFNVVIAEDEKRICSLIKALIDWDGLHLQFSRFAGFLIWELLSAQHFKTIC